MLTPNHKLPLINSRKQLTKVTQAARIDERKQKVEAKHGDKKDPPQQPPKKRPRSKGLLDIYV